MSQQPQFISGYFYPAEQPGRPDRPDPGYGVPGGGPAGGWGRPDHGLPPIIPLPPEGEGEAGQLPQLPPGSIWPPLPPDVQGKVMVLAAVAAPGHGVRAHWVVVDTNLIPERPVDPGYGHPDEPAYPEGPEVSPPQRPDRPDYPSQGLPPQRPTYPSQGGPRPPQAGQPHPGQPLPPHIRGPGQPR